MVILIRGVRADSEVYHNRESLELYRRYEFYRVDLNSDVGDEDVLEPFLDSLMSSEISGVVVSKSMVYAISYDVQPNDFIPDFIAFVKEEGKVKSIKLIDSTASNPEGGEKVDCLKSVSCVDLECPNPKKWITLPSFPISPLGFAGGILNGKLYCLSNRHLNEAYYYDRRRNMWRDVPAQPPKSFAKFRLTGKIIPDPHNDRFFVHVSDAQITCPTICTIYAWHPHRRGFAPDSWWYPIRECLPTRHWRKKVTLADKMFFFYSRKFPCLFEVLSYEDDKWLQVRWSTILPFKPKATSVCYLGNRQLCVFASSTINQPFYGSRLFFYIFAFERTSDSSITFNHCFSRSFLAKHIRIADEVVLLPGNVC